MREKVYIFGKAMYIACKGVSKDLIELKKAFSKLEKITPINLP